MTSFTFFDERQPNSLPDQKDVVELVREGEYDAGAVSRTALDRMEADGSLAQGGVRIFWSSPGYSHCCFTAQSDMEPGVYQEIERAFLSVDSSDPDGKSVLGAEGCSSFVSGIEHGWEILEKAAIDEGLV